MAVSALRSVVALGIALVVVVGGCIQPGGEDEETPSDQDDSLPRFQIILDRPTIFNETPPDDKVSLRVAQYQEEDDIGRCGVNERAVLKVYLQAYDRDGRTWTTFYRFDLDEPHRDFDVPLDGSPPFLVVGDWSACEKGATVREAEEAWNIAESERTSVTLRNHTTLDVPPGENRTEVRWNPSPYTYQWLSDNVENDNRSGNQYGDVHTSTSSAGRVCTESFKLDGWSADCLPFVLYPGTYRTVLELDQPAAQETSWGYHHDLARFDEDICTFGFKWEGLCT